QRTNLRGFNTATECFDGRWGDLHLDGAQRFLIKSAESEHPECDNGGFWNVQRNGDGERLRFGSRPHNGGSKFDSFVTNSEQQWTGLCRFNVAIECLNHRRSNLQLDRAERFYFEFA